VKVKVKGKVTRDEEEPHLSCRTCSRVASLEEDKYCASCGSPLVRRQKQGYFCGSSYVKHPIMYVDYGIGFDDCDKYNAMFARCCWPWIRVGSRKRRREEEKQWQGYELKMDDFYFNCTLINAWVLFLESNQADETFWQFT